MDSTIRSLSVRPEGHTADALVGGVSIWNLTLIKQQFLYH
ncbi:hypothetical protein TRIP_B350535 [uncultured Desulfatiglans sp.]|nr:hypothetical protein TRIP_B350535 [uncultured Desulfatiglans sp.]